jgi:hypothetical protein
MVLPPVVNRARDDRPRGALSNLNVRQIQLLQDAKSFFVGHKEALGVLIVDGYPPMFIKSGIDGGPWGGTHRGGIVRGKGYAFTQGGPSQANIATHVEGHAVAIMCQRGFMSATLLVDRAMCKVCDRNLPNALPVGTRLLVISEEEGETLVFSNHGA